MKITRYTFIQSRLFTNEYSQGIRFSVAGLGGRQWDFMAWTNLLINKQFGKSVLEICDQTITLQVHPNF